MAEKGGRGGGRGKSSGVADARAATFFFLEFFRRRYAEVANNLFKKWTQKWAATFFLTQHSLTDAMAARIYQNI